MRILPTKEEANTICMLVSIGIWVRIGWDMAEGTGTAIRDYVLRPASRKIVDTFNS